MLAATTFLISLATADVASLCATSLNSTFCSVYKSVCIPNSAVPSCKPENDRGVLAAMCKSEFVSTQACAEVVKANIKPDSFFSTIPDSKMASGYIEMMCKMMPGMNQCKTCPAPVNDVSDCDLMKTYSALCGSMEMNGCQSYQEFCSANLLQKINVPTYCEGFVIKATSTASPTQTNGATQLTYGSFFGVLVVLLQI